MKRLLLALLGLSLSGAALAGGLHSARESVEASMVVTGTIDVTPEGTVMSYTLDQPEKLPAAVAEVLGKSVPRWTFRPVLRGGKPVAARAKMSVRLVAQPIGEGRFRVAVRSAYFGDPDLGIRKDKAIQPRYPMGAIRNRLGANVYLVLRVDRAGKVTDVAAEQVNLFVVARERDLQEWRGWFADASVKAAREWTFTPADPADPAPWREIRVPVSFAINDLSDPAPAPSYGQWQAYVPGPLQPAPWPEAKPLPSGVDALPADGVYGAPSLALLTPLGPG